MTRKDGEPSLMLLISYGRVVVYEYYYMILPQMATLPCVGFMVSCWTKFSVLI